MPRQIESVLRAKGEVQLNIRKMFLMFCTLTVFAYFLHMLSKSHPYFVAKKVLDTLRECPPHYVETWTLNWTEADRRPQLNVSHTTRSGIAVAIESDATETEG
jgi:hypothetical protein